MESALFTSTELELNPLPLATAILKRHSRRLKKLDLKWDFGKQGTDCKTIINSYDDGMTITSYFTLLINIFIIIHEVNHSSQAL